MPVSNGRIYRRRPNENPKGISLDDIAKGTGLRDSRDLGTLCQGRKDYETGHVGGVNNNPLYKDSNEYHGVIKRWSKAKPVWFTGTQSFLPPDNGTDTALTNLWEERRKGNVDSPDGRRNTYLAGNPKPNFKMVYGMEVPTGEQLYGTATGSGTFLSSSGQFSINQATADYNQVVTAGGWLCGLLFDGQRIIQTDVVTLRWRYNPPMAGSGAVFHALDFDGYTHKAINPMPRVEKDTIIGVTFSGSETPTAISIPITTGFPSLPDDGNITFNELSDLVKARAIVGSGIGLADMYLCALLYHTQWAGGDNNVEIDQCLWGSAAKKYSENDNTGWNRITLSLPSTAVEGLNLASLKDLLLNGTGDDGTNGPKGWKVKLFWSTAKIPATNGQPSGTYKLIRGNDDIPGGIPVSFVDAANTSGVYPYVMITNPIQVTTNLDGSKNYYVSFSIYNPKASAVTFNKIWVAGYLDGDHSDPIRQYPTNGDYATKQVGAGSFETIDIALENIVEGDNFTDFLLYAKYGNDAEINVCGALIRVQGVSETFGEGDAYGRTWSDYSNEYAKPTNG